jgi:hypothetical protein
VVAHPGSARAARAAGRVGRFNAPLAARVEAHVDGSPREVDHRRVVLVREEWRVVDRWWTEQPVARRYFEVVLESGETTVVFHDEAGDARPRAGAPAAGGSWYTQRGA